MDPRQELYATVRKLLTEHVKEIQHIDLWNENVDFMQEDPEYQLPAVFVEFGEINWQPLTSSNPGVWDRGEGELRLHIVTSWSDDAYAEAWSLTDEVVETMRGTAGDLFGMFYPSQSLTCHSYTAVMENVEVYAVKYFRKYADL